VEKNVPHYEKYDVIIVGAGLSGLAAAIRCAHFDLRVCVLERHTRTGGLNSWYKRRGWTLDTGLHAMTNYAAPGARRAPLNRLLRQLRLPYDDMELQPQRFSVIRFPEFELTFGNDPAILEDSIAAVFPHAVDGFRRLVRHILDFDAYSLHPPHLRTRPILEQFIPVPALREAVLLPVMCYGSAEEDDMDFAQFCMLFRSIFIEGLARPARGIRPLLERLEERLRSAGGELLTGCAVREIRVERGTAQGVVTDGGRFLRSDWVLSSAGILETLNLCRPRPREADRWPPGRITLAELIAALDASPSDLPERASSVFWSRVPVPRFGCPDASLDKTFGVLCLPSNFGEAGEPARPAWARLSVLAQPEAWIECDDAAYRKRKQAAETELLHFLDELLAGAAGRKVFHDVFTPRTIRRYTGHVNGALYGSPRKVRDGRTPVKRLVVCGADQGFLGIVGALLSGVSMANYHILRGG